MGNLFDRRLAESRIRAGALLAELNAWRAASQARQPLEKQNSQVRRIAAVVEGLVERVTDTLKSVPPGELVRLRSGEEALLTAHTIWDFFRSKFAQRLDPSFREHLRVCDELAWRCYAPARQHFLKEHPGAGVGSGTREPPLVFLNTGWSPFAVGRNAAFEVDRSAGGWLAQEDFRTVVEHLPVPLIGLPWYQVAHLPDVLVVAHEAGHVVEWDFALRAALQGAVDGLGLPAERASAWSAWQPEVFADLYGCLACGGAFAASLLDFLAVDVAKVSAERRTSANWGAYPPAWLRVRLLVETLRALRLKGDADSLAARWVQTYGEPAYNTEFAEDAPPVAGVLLACDCPTLGVKVREILTCFGALDRAVAQNLTLGNPPGSGDVRVLVSAARRLWEQEPGAYAERGSNEHIRALVQVPAGTRGDSEGDRDRLATLEAADRQAGAALFRSLFPDAGG